MLKDALARKGLALHPCKCQFQTNVDTWQSRGNVVIAPGFSVSFLEADKPLTLLGTALSLSDVSGVEVANRIAMAWRMFWKMKSLLLHKDASLNSRLRLFDATLGSCALWCAESWTLRRTDEEQLQVAQRSMLRRIVKVVRYPDEAWVEWIKRATARALVVAAAAKVRDWVSTHYERKWRWAGHVARRPDTALVWRATTWRDAEWCAMTEEAGLQRPTRPSRRRWMKFEASLASFCNGHGMGWWTAAAQQREEWEAWTKMYSEGALAFH